jgi:hypothetical protein
MVNPVNWLSGLVALFSTSELHEVPIFKDSYMIVNNLSSSTKAYAIIHVPNHDDLVVYNLPSKGCFVTAVSNVLTYYASDIDKFLQDNGFIISEELKDCVRILDRPFCYTRKKKIAGVAVFSDPVQVTYFPSDLTLPMIQVGNFYHLDRMKFQESLCRFDTWLQMRGILPPIKCPITGI